MIRHQPTLFVFGDTDIYYTNISGQMCSVTDPVRWASLSPTDSMTCVNDVTNRKRVNHLLKACTLLFAYEATVAHIFGLLTYREFPVKPAGQKFFRQQPIRAAPQRTHSTTYIETHNYTTYWQISMGMPRRESPSIRHYKKVLTISFFKWAIQDHWTCTGFHHITACNPPLQLNRAEVNSSTLWWKTAGNSGGKLCLIT